MFRLGRPQAPARAKVGQKSGKSRTKVGQKSGKSQAKVGQMEFLDCHCRCMITPPPPSVSREGHRICICDPGLARRVTGAPLYPYQAPALAVRILRPNPFARFYQICLIFARRLQILPDFARFLPDYPGFILSDYLHESLRNP